MSESSSSSSDEGIVRIRSHDELVALVAEQDNGIDDLSAIDRFVLEYEPFGSQISKDWRLALFGFIAEVKAAALAEQAAAPPGAPSIANIVGVSGVEIGEARKHDNYKSIVPVVWSAGRDDPVTGKWVDLVVDQSSEFDLIEEEEGNEAVVHWIAHDYFGDPMEWKKFFGDDNDIDIVVTVASPEEYAGQYLVGLDLVVEVIVTDLDDIYGGIDPFAEDDEDDEGF